MTPEEIGLIVEKKLVNELIKLHLKPRHQYLIGTMHVDIAFPHVNLVIEIDGSQHKEHMQHMTDRRRYYILEKKGWYIKNFSTSQVKNNSVLIAKKISDYVIKLEAGESINYCPKSIINIENFMDDNFKNLFNLVNKSNESIFFAGKAGTGKSTFIQLLMQSTDKKMVLLAPTGISAINISGQTIHSFFKLPPGILSEDDIKKSVLNKNVNLNCSKLDYLIFDEISMVRADIFDAIDKILRKIKDSNQPFGGIRIILFGDLYQLSPVVPYREEKILTENLNYDLFYFFGSKVFKKLKLHVHNFTKVYRQNDLKFIELLDNIRKGKVNSKDIQILKKRLLKNPDSLPFSPVILTSKNKTVQKYNLDKLEQLELPSHFYTAKIFDNFPKGHMPVEEKIELKLGARVMVLKNIKGKYVNGDLGTVMVCNAASVDVKLDRTGKIETIRTEIFDNFNFYYSVKSGKIKRWSVGQMIQIPLRLSWAMTIHKSQGLTLTNIYVDATPGIWQPGQLYVAFSRCTSLDGLFLKEVPNYAQFYDNPIVDTFFKQTTSKI